MKLIHVIGIILVPAFAFVWCFQIWSVWQWNHATLQDEGSEKFYEIKRQNKDAQAFVREASNDDPPPVDQATNVSGSSWEERLEKKIDHWVHAIKSIGHRSRRAPPGVYFTLTYVSVRTPSGITGVEAGTQVACIKDEGQVLLVKAGSVEFEAKRQYLTNDLDIADLVVRNDAEAQQVIASYIAQQQAIEQRGDRRKMQPSGQH